MRINEKRGNGKRGHMRRKAMGNEECKRIYEKNGIGKVEMGSQEV